MYESDKVVGKTFAEAVRFIEIADLWDEVVDLRLDEFGVVTKVLH